MLHWRFNRRDVQRDLIPSHIKNVDEFIDKIAQPSTRRMRGNSDFFRRQLQRGRCATSEYHGLINPPKLNISTDTLSKIKSKGE